MCERAHLLTSSDGGPMVRRPVGMPVSARTEEIILSGWAHDVIAREAAQGMVRELARDLDRAEARIARLERRICELEWDALPAQEDAA